MSRFWTARRESGAKAAIDVPKDSPMHVVKISSLLAFDELKSFEDLDGTDALVEWQPEMKTIFVSHTWLGHHHPDPDGHKLTLLKEVLQAALAGTVSVSPHWTQRLAGMAKEGHISSKKMRSIVTDGYIWIDYCCIPQSTSYSAREQRSAGIDTIPLYVARATLFVVLAGAWSHKEESAPRDLREWMARGWCRMELLCNALSLDPRPFIVIESLSAICSFGSGGIGTRGWMTSPVGHGKFTREADRTKLGPIILRLVETRKQQALDQGDLVMYRVLHASEARLLSGTGTTVAREETLAQWLRGLRFKSPRDGEKTGICPLRCAVSSGRLDILLSLLDFPGIDVEAPLRKSYTRFEGMMRGQTVLHLAAALHDDDDTLVLELIKRGANPRRLDWGCRMHALHYAAAAGNRKIFDTLMERVPDLADESDQIGLTPWLSAVLCGQSALCEHVRRNHPQAAQAAHKGFSSASVAVMYVGDLDTLRCTIAAGADVNYAGSHAEAKPLLRAIYVAAKLVVRFGHRHSKRGQFSIEQFAFCAEATALHRAAFAGNLGAMRILLDAGAKVDTQHHPRAMTPLHLAALRGHINAVEYLLGAGASVSCTDAYGVSAADWAARRGHTNLSKELRRASRGEASPAG